MNETNYKTFNKLFPFFAGLSSDLLFWGVVDTLFLTIVKKFTASQIVSLTSISLITCILLQIPLLQLIKKLGNTKSVQLGSFLLLLSSILLTFGENYITVVLGKIICEIAFTFLNMINAILQNNLDLQGKENEYIKERTKANTVYAVATMLVSFCASIMFNINYYLPMIGCVTVCFVCFILSFFMIDYTKSDSDKKEIKNKNPKLFSSKYSHILVAIILSYGFYYPIVNSGQSNGKLFIQQELLKTLDVNQTAIIIGIILCISRIVRVISNMSFHKIHQKYNDKVGFLLPCLLALSLCLIFGGYFISLSFSLKIIVMGLGYIIILFIRDPFKVYIQDLALKTASKKQQQTILATLDLSRKIMRAIMSLSFTIILLYKPMLVVIGILILLSIVEIGIALYLYQVIRQNNKVN